MNHRHSQDALVRNVRRYQVFNLVVFTPFMMPVIVLFWRDNGLDLLDVHLLQAIFAVAIVVLEVPTGMVADRLGKRASLLAASWVICGGMVLYALGRGFGAFLVAEVALALGMSLYSGAGSALLFDSLKALSREQDFERFEGRARALQMVSVAGCTLAGGVVGAYSYRATVWLTAAGSVAGLLVARTLIEVQSASAHTASWRAGLAAYRELVGSSLRFVRKHALVRWQIVFLSMLSASSLWLLWLYQPYMEAAGLPVWSFGVAFAAFSLFAAAASHVAHRVDQRCGRFGTLALLSVLQVAPPALMAQLVHPLSVVAILGQQAVRGLAPPTISARVLRYTHADKRATVLSLSSMGGRLLYAATAPLFGWLVERVSLSVGLRVQAAVLALALGALLLAYQRIPLKYFTVKPEVVARQ